MFASNNLRFAARHVASVTGRRTAATVAAKQSSHSGFYQPVLFAAGVTVAAAALFQDREVRTVYYCSTVYQTAHGSTA